jgi:hypothetical protein
VKEGIIFQLTLFDINNNNNNNKISSSSFLSIFFSLTHSQTHTLYLQRLSRSSSKAHSIAHNFDKTISIMPNFPSSLSLVLLLTSSYWVVGITHAFVVTPTPTSSARTATSRTTRLYIEKHIADMIDQELWREQHKKEFEAEWMKKNRGAIFHAMGGDDAVASVGVDAVVGGGGSRAGGVTNLMLTEDDADAFRQLRKDKVLARNDPMRYCADRCVSTGSCEVFEDIFDFTPQQVMTFCTDCVLSNGDEPCELPASFFDMLEDGPEQLQL